MSNRNKGISKIFLINKLSATLIIPIEIARKYGLDKPVNVIVEETDAGILLRQARYLTENVLKLPKLSKECTIRSRIECTIADIGVL